MSEPATNCTKCNAKMEEGFIVDYGHGGVTRVATWVEHPPEHIKVLKLMPTVKIDDKRQFPVRTFRCPSCGFLESYAK